MKKIIFFVFAFYSQISFSLDVGYEGNCSLIKSDLSGFCKIISRKSISFMPVSGDEYRYYFSWLPDRSQIQKTSLCDYGLRSFFALDNDASRTYFLHPACESEIVYLLGSYRYGCDPADDPALGDCNCPNFAMITSYFEVCSLITLEKSQVSAAKTNDLISESNSEFSSIASSNATISNLLAQIKYDLFALLAKNYAVFGMSENPPESVDDPTFSNSNVDLTEISPLIHNFSECPADFSFTVLGSSHHISYQPLCDFSGKLRPLVINAARVAAAWILIGAL